jgi:type VI secretion system protein ImpI
VAFSVVITINNGQDGTTHERAFGRLPIRIGRNALNDLRLELPFVSQFHCVLSEHGGRVLLHDLGSRNGILLREHNQVPPNGYVALEDHGWEFYIPPYGLQVEVEELDDPKSSSRLPVPSERTHIIMPSSIRAAKSQEFAGLYQSYRSAFAQLLDSVARTQVPPDEKSHFFVDLARTYPALMHEPEFQALARGAVAQAKPAPSRETALASASLAGMRDLLARYLPTQTLESPQEVAAFLSTLAATLDVLFRCIIPLRDGQKQFEAHMRLERTAPAGNAAFTGSNPAFTGAHPVNPAVVGAQVSGANPARGWGPPGADATVETARSPQEIAAVLLDWNRLDRAHESADGIFADVMIHQIALLNGVMAGVNTLLAELAPTAIEASAEKKARGSLGGGPFRFRQLWEAYQERYGDLAEEERYAFELIFGARFAAAYRQFHSAATSPARTVAPPPDGPAPRADRRK